MVISLTRVHAAPARARRRRGAPRSPRPRASRERAAALLRKRPCRRAAARPTRTRHNRGRTPGTSRGACLVVPAARVLFKKSLGEAERAALALLRSGLDPVEGRVVERDRDGA